MHADTDFIDKGRQTLSQHQKFAKAKKIVEKLPSLASEVWMKSRNSQKTLVR